MLLVKKYPKYGPVISIAKNGFSWKIVITGTIHIKKCSPMLGVNQYFPAARNLKFQAICRFPEKEQVLFPHRGSFLPSHNSLSLTKNNLDANNNQQ